MRLIPKSGQNLPKRLKTFRLPKKQPLSMQGVAMKKTWYRRVELNHRSMGYESIALTAELRRQ